MGAALLLCRQKLVKGLPFNLCDQQESESKDHPRKGAPHLHAFLLPMQTPSKTGFFLAKDGSSSAASTASCQHSILVRLMRHLWHLDAIALQGKHARTRGPHMHAMG